MPGSSLQLLSSPAALRAALAQELRGLTALAPGFGVEGFRVLGYRVDCLGPRVEGFRGLGFRCVECRGVGFRGLRLTELCFRV